MTRNVFVLTLLALLVPWLSGCVTSPPTVQRLENRTKAVVWLATTKILQEHPDWKPQFQIALDDLILLQKTGEFGVVEVLAIVQRLPVKELQSGDSALVIGATVLFFQDELSTLSVTQPEEVKAVVRGMVAGLQLAGVSPSSQ